MKAWQVALIAVLAGGAGGVVVLLASRAPALPPPKNPFLVSDVEQAEMQMSSFATSIRMYYLNNRKTPASLDELMQADPLTGQPYMDSVPLDPWNRPYEFVGLGGQKFELRSYGKDTIAGTDDDIVWPRAD